MSENLPVQVALFDDPLALRDFGDRELAELDGWLFSHIGGVMPTLRRQVGLMAWAQWHHKTPSAYGVWIMDMAKACGVDERTIVRWRQKVTTADKRLKPPTLAAVKAKETVSAGQEVGTDKMSELPAPEPEDGARMEPATTATTEPGPATEASSSPGRPPTKRQAVVAFLGVLRSYDPVELGEAMTPDERREVRNFAADVADVFGPAPAPRQRPGPVVVNTPPTPFPAVRPKRHAPSCACGTCAKPKVKG